MVTNRTAFLDTIAYSEGTKGIGDDGYNVIVGGTLFTDYSDHPRKDVFIERFGVWSTAAGRYQEKESNYDFYKVKLRLLDFSPASQDAMAIQQILEKGALPFIDRGLLDTAILRCAELWASFPTSTYGQSNKTFLQLRAAYIAAGGIYNACSQTISSTQAN